MQIIDIRQAAARLSPSGGTTLQTPFSPVSFGKSFMKIRSAVPENGCLIAYRQHSPFARQRHDFRQAAARRCKPFPPVSFGNSFMKIRSAVPENGSYIFGGWKKTKKNKKKQKKHL